MGRSPVAPGGTYVSIYGGYIYSDAPDVRGLDAGPTVPQLEETDVYVDHNGFGGLEFGYALPDGSAWLGIDRIEVFFEAGHGSLDDDGRDFVIGLRDVAGNTGTTSASGAGVPHQTERERGYYDFGLRLRADDHMFGDQALPVFVEPFFRYAHDDTFMGFTNGANIFGREGNIDAYFLGVLAGVDPEMPLSETLTLVGSFSGGIYYYHGEGDFRSSANTFAAFNESFDDTKEGVGFRGRAMLALRHMISPGMSISLFGGIDFWSDVPYANLPVNTVNTQPAKVRSSDEFDVKAGVRVTISLDDLPG